VKIQQIVKLIVITTNGMSSFGTYISLIFMCALFLNQATTKMNVKLNVNNPLDIARTKHKAIHLSFHPGTIDTIKTKRYANIENLESVRIPASVKVIEAHAFADCPKLSHVHFEGDRAPEVHPLAFAGCNLGRSS